MAIQDLQCMLQHNNGTIFRYFAYMYLENDQSQLKSCYGFIESLPNFTQEWNLYLAYIFNSFPNILAYKSLLNCNELLSHQNYNKNCHIKGVPVVNLENEISTSYHLKK